MLVSWIGFHTLPAYLYCLLLFKYYFFLKCILRMQLLNFFRQHPKGRQISPGTPRLNKNVLLCLLELEAASTSHDVLTWS